MATELRLVDFGIEMGLDEGHTGPKTTQNRKNRNQTNLPKSPWKKHFQKPGKQIPGEDIDWTNSRCYLFRRQDVGQVCIVHIDMAHACMHA